MGIAEFILSHAEGLHPSYAESELGRGKIADLRHEFDRQPIRRQAVTERQCGEVAGVG